MDLSRNISYGMAWGQDESGERLGFVRPQNTRVSRRGQASTLIPIVCVDTDASARHGGRCMEKCGGVTFCHDAVRKQKKPPWPTTCLNPGWIAFQKDFLADIFPKLASTPSMPLNPSSGHCHGKAHTRERPFPHPAPGFLFGGGQAGKRAISRWRARWAFVPAANRCGCCSKRKKGHRRRCRSRWVFPTSARISKETEWKGWQWIGTSAPIHFLAGTLKEKGLAHRWLVGAKTADELCYPDEADAVATDDGSAGEAGSVVALAEKELARGKYAIVQACGPKGMLRAVKALAEKAGLPAELSVERIMRCGVGLCGSCALDDGRCACREGPVFRFG